MAPDRITNAIDSLIAHLIPSDPNEDEDAAQERHDACFELVKTIIDRYLRFLTLFPSAINLSIVHPPLRYPPTLTMLPIS